MKKGALSLRFYSLCIVFSLLCSCGPVRLIAPYDSITDQKVTRLHEDVTTHLISLEREIEKGDTIVYRNGSFYDQARVDIEVLKARAAAIENNSIVVAQLNELNTMIDELESLHLIGFTDIEQIKALRQPFASAFTAIIKLQMALKRGEIKNP